MFLSLSLILVLVLRMWRGCDGYLRQYLMLATNITFLMRLSVRLILGRV